MKPDGTVFNQSAKFLWDAKYKADRDRGKRRVSATDVYEANAFVEAANVKQIALLYPRMATDDAIGPGEVQRFETIELDSGTIYGLAVEACGISARGEFQVFADNLAAGVRTELDAAIAVAA